MPVGLWAIITLPYPSCEYSERAVADAGGSYKSPPAIPCPERPVTTRQGADKSSGVLQARIGGNGTYGGVVGGHNSLGRMARRGVYVGVTSCNCEELSLSTVARELSCSPCRDKDADVFMFTKSLLPCCPSAMIRLDEATYAACVGNPYSSPPSTLPN